MKARWWGACGLVAAAIACSAAPALAADRDLNAYRVEATPQNLRALANAGYDVTEGRNSKRGTVEVVATAGQISQLKVGARKVVDGAGRTAADRSRLKIPGNGTNAPAQDDATAGASDTNYTVWRKYDAFNEPDNEDHPEYEHEQYTEFYDRMVEEHPDLVKDRVVGHTDGGRDIIALQVTKNPTGADVPGKPAVLYNAMQHAREWLAGETCKRTLSYFVDNYGKTTSAGLEVTPLVDQNELWFVCVNNPDGYEYTFTDGNRLWRKNLRDNDNSGTIELGDGVDPNRNFSANWGRDNEGSSDDPTTETYRGPSAASEPETKAMESLFAEIHPVWQKNDHTAAELLLYPQGFQQDTPTADNEIFTALAGDPFKPGIEGFLPELSAGLYITNGDFTDWAYSTQKTLSYTPEGTEAEDPNVTGFEYPDSEKQVQQEFRRHLPFVLDLAKSAKDPTEPVSHLGNKAEDFTVDSFKYSYGDPQQVQATVKRKLGDVTMKFSVNGGPTLKVPTKDFTGGERYYKNDAVYYHRVRGFVSGTKPGDKVRVWFSAGGKNSPDFTYDAVNESSNPVLLLSDEDWSGVQPAAPQSGPAYLDTYKALLDSQNISYDVYDVSKDRTAPDNLGVLSHYSHVVWYTGDDYVPREPDAPGGSGITKLAVDTQNRVRDFLNEGGKLFYTGQNAGRVYAEGYTYNPFQAEEQTYCQNENPTCIAVQDDFLQYWLGANTYVGNAGTAEDGSPLTISGFADPFDDHYTLANPDPGPDDDPEDPHTAALLVTSSIYDPADYPQWADSKKVLAWDRPGASPFEPFTGDWFVSAGTDDAAYKRFQHPADLTGATSGTFSFRTSYDLEADYDYMFVEIHTVGQDDWTTLAENTGKTSDDTGLSCPATAEDSSNWQNDHPFLAHYQTKSANGETCDPTGSSGEWNAATGNSGGWKLWQLDIPNEFLNKEVEISITVANDPASQGLGVWIDDAALATSNDSGEFATSFEADEPDPDGGFTRPGPPEGTENPATGWERAQSAPFIEGAAVSTPDTVYTGFGLEKIDGTAKQQALLADVFEHLGAPKKPAFAAPTPTPDTTGGPTTPPGGGGGGTTPPAGQRGLSVFRIGSQKLKVARRLGLRFTARCPTSCPLVVEMRVDKATQRKLKLKSRRVGRLRTTITGPTRTMRVKFNKATKKALRNRKRVRVIVTAVVPGAQDGGRFIVSSRLR
jgi:murein tripeptide amidase MpaA